MEISCNISTKKNFPLPNTTLISEESDYEGEDNVMTTDSTPHKSSLKTRKQYWP